MQIKISLTREEVDAIFADHFRKMIPDLQEVKSGVMAEIVVVVVAKDEANRK